MNTSSKKIMFLGSRGGKADKLTSVNKPIVFANVEFSTYHNPIGLHGLLRAELYMVPK
jgi:hypothetical protein